MLPYEFERTRRAVAWRLLAAIPVLWLYVLGMLAWDRIPNDHGLVTWSVRGFAVATVVLLYFGVWNLRNPGTYRVRVDREEMVVEYPGNERYSYRLPVGEIVRVEHRRRHDHAGRRDEGHWVVTADGESYPLTGNYSSSPRAVVAALQEANPAIGMEHRTDYRPF